MNRYARYKGNHYWPWSCQPCSSRNCWILYGWFPVVGPWMTGNRAQKNLGCYPTGWIYGNCLSSVAMSWKIAPISMDVVVFNWGMHIRKMLTFFLPSRHINDVLCISYHVQYECDVWWYNILIKLINSPYFIIRASAIIIKVLLVEIQWP